MGEEEVSPPCKIPKIRKPGQRVPLHSFIELQECISGNRLAESAGWNKFRAALRLRGWYFRGKECVCVHMSLLKSTRTRVLCPRLQTAAGRPPSNDKVWYESPGGSEGQRRPPKMEQARDLEAGGWAGLRPGGSVWWWALLQGGYPGWCGGCEVQHREQTTIV